MTWKILVDSGRAQPHKVSRSELTGLREIVSRNLRDAGLVGLSADNKLGLAYEAELISAKMATLCAGYRIKGTGHHKTMFEALPFAMGKSEQNAADLFEGYRRQRNALSYDVAGGISDSDAESALAEATSLADRVEEWIAKHHPGLA